MTAKLVAEEGPLKDVVLSFEDGDQWIIGRDPEASQLLVADSSVSRRHVLCRRTAEGIVAENLSTTNPAQVNHEPLEHPRLLEQGDIVLIGNNTFRYYAETTAHLFEEDQNIASSHTIGDMSIPIPEEPHEEPKKDIAEEQQGLEPAPKEYVAEEPAVKEQVPEKLVEEEHPADTHGDTIFEGEGDDKDLAKINFDLMETGRWLLRVINGPNSGAEFSMQSGSSYIIGTDPNTCDIVFYDKSVSRQHVRITISQDDQLTIEDLKSRNGTRLEGDLLEQPRSLPPQVVVTIGTTSFVVYDREGEMQTIIAPLMPSIVKVLQQETPAPTEEEFPARTPASSPSHIFEGQPALSAPPPPVEVPKKKTKHSTSSFILTGALVGLFLIVGYGVSTLFQEPEKIVEKEIDTDKILKDALIPFPSVKSSFNKTIGRLVLVGHVLTAADRSQLLNSLQGLRFIKDIDDTGVIIDEYVWREANQLLASYPKWAGISVSAPEAGNYIVSGYVQNRSQAEDVWDYMTRNFPYIDLLENRIVVDEDVANGVTVALRDQGLNAITVQASAGEIVLSGSIPTGKIAIFQALIEKFKQIPGVRNVKNFVNESAQAESVINISDRYQISGSSRLDSGDLNVVINGRILSQGDVLDGMTITNITSTYVLLEKDEILYRIDFKR